MAEQLNIYFNYNKENQDVENFVNSFEVDLQSCLRRFRIEVNFERNNGNHSNRILLSFLSNQDFGNTEYISQCQSCLNRESSFLINLEPQKGKSQSEIIHHYHTFNFWNIAVETGETILYRKDFNDRLPDYWDKITDIAVEIHKFSEQEQVKNIKEKVYLSLTELNQNADRDNLKRDLNDIGFDVIPEKNLSVDFNESTGQIETYIRQSKMLIHMIPSVYHSYFKDRHLSLVEHQCNVSAGLISELENTPRIIWIPSDMEVVDEDLQIFIEKIQRDPEQTSRTTILKCALEDLKRVYRRILKSDEAEVSEEITELPDIYFISDEAHSDLFEILKNDLRGSHYKVARNYSGLTYNNHLNFLAHARIVIIQYTQENSQWFNVKVNDILKSPGLENARSYQKIILAKASEGLDSSRYERFFTDVYTGDSNELELDIAIEEINN